MGPRFSGDRSIVLRSNYTGGFRLRILTRVATPPDWTVVDGALERTFELPTFAEAIAFVNRVAELADAENHHPDIGVSYKKVTLRWTTHSEGGITDRDEDLARRSADLA
jgi:4a-hydroxytetrahydrobiopterin dehydratase